MRHGGDASGDDVTLDALFGGALRLRQPRRGHRFGLDALVLAGAARPHAAGAHVLDVGTGCGVVALALLHQVRDPAPRSVVGVEIQPALARLAAQNAAAHGLPLSVVRADVRAAPLRAATFDLVVSNPPYRRVGTGRLAPVPERAQARHELTLSLEELVASVRDLLAPKGRFLFVHLSERRDEIVAACRAGGLPLTRLQPVVHRRSGRTRVTLFEACAGETEAPVESELPCTDEGFGDGRLPLDGRWKEP